MTQNDPNWGDFVQNACLRLTVALFAIYLIFASGSAHAIDADDTETVSAAAAAR